MLLLPNKVRWVLYHLHVLISEELDCVCRLHHNINHPYTHLSGILSSSSSSSFSLPCPPLFSRLCTFREQSRLQSRWWWSSMRQWRCCFLSQWCRCSRMGSWSSCCCFCGSRSRWLYHFHLQRLDNMMRHSRFHGQGLVWGSTWWEECCEDCWGWRWTCPCVFCWCCWCPKEERYIHQRDGCCLSGWLWAWVLCCHNACGSLKLRIHPYIIQSASLFFLLFSLLTFMFTSPPLFSFPLVMWVGVHTLTPCTEAQTSDWAAIPWSCLQTSPRQQGCRSWCSKSESSAVRVRVRVRVRVWAGCNEWHIQWASRYEQAW